MHKKFMLAALKAASLGAERCTPNPRVGAVAVSQGKIIASAYHKGAGTAHAELSLLQNLPQGLKDIVLYVTLEPCNHWGRTPPCTLAIIDYGIKEVVYGFKDPNPKVKENNTPKILQEKGIKIHYFPLPEIDDFYESYAYWVKTKKPWVTAKLAQSLDARIAGQDGEPVQLSNDKVAILTHELRQKADVILTTAKTIKTDNPQLNVRLNGKTQAKTIAILDRHLSLTPEATVFSTAEHCHIYYDEDFTLKNPLPNCSYHPIVTNEGGLRLNSIIEHLGIEGYHEIFVEAGALVFSNLHHENLVQRSFFYLTPKVLGDGAIPAFSTNFILRAPKKCSWQIIDDNAIAKFDWQEK